MEVPRRELWSQIELAWPISVGNLLMRSFSVMSMIFVGQLCSSELFAAASLGTTFANVTGHSVMVGLSSALATLASQAYGARDYRAMNAALQRSVLVLCGACVPISILWFWSNEFLFYICQQEAEVSLYASHYLRSFIPSLWLYALLQCLQTWLQAQGINRPIMWSASLSALLHPLFNYVLIVPLRLGYLGSAWSNTLTQALWLAMLLTYIYASGLAREVGLRWSFAEGCQQLKAYMKLAVPGMLMLAEWWAAESIILLGGALRNGPLNVAVLSIYQTVNAVAYMVSYGVHVAANTRVGNHLGSGDAPMAKLSAYVAPFLGAIVGAVLAAILRLIGPYYPLAFTKDEAVVRLTHETTVVACFLIFADGVQAACTGTLKGTGKQHVGWVSTIGSYFGVGVPLGVLLSFVFHMGPRGLCIGLAAGCYCYMLSTMAIVATTDWDKEVGKARQRLAAQAPSEATTPDKPQADTHGEEKAQAPEDPPDPVGSKDAAGGGEGPTTVTEKGPTVGPGSAGGSKALGVAKTQQMMHWSTSTAVSDEEVVIMEDGKLADGPIAPRRRT